MVRASDLRSDYGGSNPSSAIFIIIKFKFDSINVNAILYFVPSVKQYARPTAL